MSAIENIPAPSQPNEAGRTPRTTVAQLFLRAIQRWQRNRAIGELSRLDERQLDDIGISRNDIPRVVEGLFGPEELRAQRLPEDVSAAGVANVAATAYPRAA